MKYQYLNPVTAEGKTSFDLQSVIDLKSKIASGEIDRLTRRANKKASALTFVPQEYADSPDVVLAVEGITDIFWRQRLDLKATLLSVVLRLLQQNGLASRIVSRELNAIEVKGAILRTELEWWFDNAGPISTPPYAALLDRELPMIRDFAGSLYQSLSTAGAKASGGSYDTPNRVVDGVTADYVRENSVVLDPCCGTGQFLLAAAENVIDPTNLWGFDIDEIAMRLARLNIIMRFPDSAFTPNIYCKNTLLAFPFHARIVTVRRFPASTLFSQIPHRQIAIFRPRTSRSFRHCSRP